MRTSLPARLFPTLELLARSSPYWSQSIWLGFAIQCHFKNLQRSSAVSWSTSFISDIRLGKVSRCLEGSAREQICKDYWLISAWASLPSSSFFIFFSTASYTDETATARRPLLVTSDVLCWAAKDCGFNLHVFQSHSFSFFFTIFKFSNTTKVC